MTPNATFPPRSAREAERWGEMATASVTLEKAPGFQLSSPLHKYSGLPKHVWLSPVLLCCSDGLQIQDPPASASRNAGIIHVHCNAHFPWEFWHFLHFTFPLYTSKAGLRRKTFFHPIHPFNLTVCGRGVVCTRRTVDVRCAVGWATCGLCSVSVWV